MSKEKYRRLLIKDLKKVLLGTRVRKLRVAFLRTLISLVELTSNSEWESKKQAFIALSK